MASTVAGQGLVSQPPNSREDPSKSEPVALGVAVNVTPS